MGKEQKDGKYRQNMKQRREPLLQRAYTALDLPTHAIANLPHVELFGENELRVENHRGILAYGTEEIHISGGRYLLKVQGIDLDLRTMTGVELLITGKITSISLE